MKKYLLLILVVVMLIPLYANAETCDKDKISINSITIESKSDSVEELESATASGKIINLNLSMSEVGDNIEYKIVVKNDSNEDYELNNNDIVFNSDYIEYTLELEDSSNIVKANSSKTFYLKLQYKNEVPNEIIKTGTYTDNQSMVVNLSTKNGTNLSETIKNPNTGNSSLYLILLVLVISGLLILILKKTKYAKYLIIIVGITITIPMSVYALCKCDIQIDSTILINQEKTFYESGMTGACPSSIAYRHKVGENINYYNYFIYEEDNNFPYLKSFETAEECENNISQFAINNNKDISKLSCKKDFFGAKYYGDYWEEEFEDNQLNNIQYDFAFFRHKVKNGRLINSDLAFTFDHNVYYLIGGNSNELALKNLETVKNIFGNDSCTRVSNFYYIYGLEGYSCKVNNIEIQISDNNDLEFTTSRFIETAFLYSDGASGIGHCT